MLADAGFNCLRQFTRSGNRSKRARSVPRHSFVPIGRGAPSPLCFCAFDAHRGGASLNAIAGAADVYPACIGRCAAQPMGVV